MGVDDGAEFGRRRQARNERCRHHRRHRQDDGVAWAQRHRKIAEIEPGHAVRVVCKGAQPLAENDFAAVRFDEPQRRLDEGRRQSVAREQRTVAAPTRGQRFADHRGSEAGGACRRLGVERGQQQRPDQPVVQRPFAIDDVADGRARRGAQQAQNGQIIARARSRHAAIAVEYPPRNAAVIGA